MFRSQAIHGDHKVETPKRGPFGRNWPNRAGHQLHFNMHALQFGKQLAQLAVAHQRFSTDYGNVKWTVPANEHAVYQLRAAIIREPAQWSIHEVFRLICITAGTM